MLLWMQQSLEISREINSIHKFQVLHAVYYDQSNFCQEKDAPEVR